MIKLVKGRKNVITLDVQSSIDCINYSAILSILDKEYTIYNIAEPDDREFVFTAAEVALFGGRGREGVLTITDTDDEIVTKSRIWFKPIDKAAEAQNFQTIYVTIVNSGAGEEGGGGGGGDDPSSTTGGGVRYLGEFGTWVDVPSSSGGFSDFPKLGDLIVVKDGSAYYNLNESETESLEMHGVDAVGRVLSSDISFTLDGTEFQLTKGFTLGLTQVLALKQANVDLIPVYKSYHGKWLLIYSGESDESYSKTLWSWMCRISDESDQSAIIAEVASRLTVVENDTANISQRITNLETNIDEVVETKVAEIAPQVIGDNIRETVVEVVNEIVPDMIDDKISDSVGEINTVLDDLNGEVV